MSTQAKGDRAATSHQPDPSRQIGGHEVWNLYLNDLWVCLVLLISRCLKVLTAVQRPGHLGSCEEQRTQAEIWGLCSPWLSPCGAGGCIHRLHA